MKRRNFVKTLASLAAVSSVSGVASASSPVSRGSADAERQGPAADNRAYTGGRYTLEIDGVDVGLIDRVEGGAAVAEVVADGASGGFVGKRLGALTYEPLKVTLNLPPHADVTKLINDSFAGLVRKNIAIVTYDFEYKAVSAREAANAVLTEVALEQVAAADAKDPVSVELTFQSDSIRTVARSGAAAKLTTKTKSASNFRFTVSGFDAAIVTAVAMPSAKRVGGAPSKAVSGATSRIDLSPFTIDVTANKAQPFHDWMEQFAIARKDTAERTAKLELLTADLKEVVYTVSLSGVGIAAVRTDALTATQERLARSQITLYAERITYGS